MWWWRRGGGVMAAVGTGRIHRWAGALCLPLPVSSSHGSSASSESRRPYAAGRHPEMLRILGLAPPSPSASGSGAGSSGRGKPRRSHGATVWTQPGQKEDRVNEKYSVFFSSLQHRVELCRGYQGSDSSGGVENEPLTFHHGVTVL